MQNFQVESETKNMYMYSIFPACLCWAIFFYGLTFTVITLIGYYTNLSLHLWE